MHTRLTLTSNSTSLCCVTMVFVLPHSQFCVSFSMSSCCNGKYGWKNASYSFLSVMRH